jgi:glycerol-3-phosphate cytidylyltransferase
MKKSMSAKNVAQNKQKERRLKMSRLNSGTKIPKGKKIVLFQGTFDIINWGHVKCFRKCKTYGDFFIVALNTNQLVKKYKKREPVLPYWQKKFIIESFKYVDLVVPANKFSPLELLKKYNVDVFVIGDEWTDTKQEEIEYMKSKGGEVKFTPRFRGVIATSIIKQILLKEAMEGLTSEVI